MDVEDISGSVMKWIGFLMAFGACIFAGWLEGSAQAMGGGLLKGLSVGVGAACLFGGVALSNELRAAELPKTSSLVLVSFCVLGAALMVWPIILTA